MIRSFGLAFFSSFSSVVRAFRCRASQFYDNESDDESRNSPMTFTSTFGGRRCVLFHNHISHYSLRVEIVFYGWRLGIRRSKRTDFCINECIKDYRHDAVIALARSVFIHGGVGRCTARVRIFLQI